MGSLGEMMVFSSAAVPHSQAQPTDRRNTIFGSRTACTRQIDAVMRHGQR